MVWAPPSLSNTLKVLITALHFAGHGWKLAVNMTRPVNESRLGANVSLTLKYWTMQMPKNRVRATTSSIV